MEFFQKIPRGALYILEKLNAGHQAYLVGGCVRDLLMGLEPHDWDITTSASPREVSFIFMNAGCKVVETGLKHGTVTVYGLDGGGYEITTFRRDGIYIDGRHPQTVQFCDNLQEDLARRDFSINAMAWAPWVGLVDPFDGRKDLEDGVIRCVGNPDERFQEDALRILRAIRFAAKLGFRIAPQTAAASRGRLSMLNCISQERKREELVKLLLGKEAEKVLSEYSDIIGSFVPEIVPCIGFEQNNPYHTYSVWGHIAASVGYAPADPIIRLTMFLHDIGKPRCFQIGADGHGHFHGHGKVSAEMAKNILDRLRFDKATAQKVIQLVEVHDRFIEPNKKAVRRLLNKIGPEQFDRFMEVRKADVMAQNHATLKPRLEKVELLKQLKADIVAESGESSGDECFDLKSLAVNGKDLIAMGFEPGPKLGEALNMLLLAVMDEAVENKKDSLIGFLMEHHSE